MKVKDLESILNAALMQPDDIKLKKKYSDAITEYLAENRSTDEVISIITKGICIDQGANYAEHIESLPKEEITKIWKKIRSNKTIRTNAENNGLRFLTSLFALALTNAVILESQQNQIVDMIMGMISDEDKRNDTAYELIIKEYLVDVFPQNCSFPEWGKIKSTSENKKKLAQIILKITQNESPNAYFSIRHWASSGLKSAEAQIEKEKIESKIPRSKIDDLQSILEHYKLVEKQLRQDVYELARSEKKIETLEQNIFGLQGEKRDLLCQNKMQEANIQELQKKLDQAEQRIKEQKDINRSFATAQKYDEEAMRKEIAELLSAEYQDFQESLNDQMDILLGEIYREKIKNIFKLLERKGIKMEK